MAAICFQNWGVQSPSPLDNKRCEFDEMFMRNVFYEQINDDDDDDDDDDDEVFRGCFHAASFRYNTI